MKSRLLLVPFLIVSLVFHPVRAEDHEAASRDTEVAPKFFLLGMIMSAVASEVFSIFGKWAVSKLMEGAAPSIPAATQFSPARIVLKSAGESGEPAPAVSGNPVAPKGMELAKSNYHGVHFAIAVLDAERKNLDMRPLSQGFKSGERFKLRVVATFTGDMKIENINPRSERKHIYPADENMRARLEAGKETLIPAGPDEYFEFAKTTGEEQLVITMRDPRATASTMSRSEVHRKDETHGSNFVQEVTDDTYPVISESVKLMHF